jgi:outer membrane lipoprotein SlyB
VNGQPPSRIRGRVKLVLAALVLVILPAIPLQSASGAPAAPTGLTAFALDGAVALSWTAVPGAANYQVFRSTTSAAAGSLIGSPTGATFKDTAATNSTTFYYTVKAVNVTPSPASAQADATARARTCSSGNAVVVENCFPGTSAWKLANQSGAFDGGVDGFATQSSINRGQSVDLKVKASGEVPYRIEIYRSGWYGGTQGRLVSALPGRTGAVQPPCEDGAGNTGLKDCSNWTVTDTITTSADWAPGIYLLRLVRTDTGGDSHILLTVRDDAATPAVQYVLPTTTYQAYNAYAGKSLYTYNSVGANTVSGAARAVKVSFDRPYDQGQRDWYTGEDVRILGWLERQGYDMGYTTSVDVHTGVPNLNARKAIISGAHDEYWSAQMRTAVTNARNAGSGVLFFGANAVYWRVRFESSPLSNTANRVLVGYKSTEGGPADPSGTATGTWRDPAGANNPENSLIGEQYIGQNTSGYSPLTVSAAQGKHRIWRYTALNSLATGTSQNVGSTLVGWEWDARAANGGEPSGVSTIAATGVQGDILQDAGKVYAPGSAVQQSTYFKAGPTGGVVFATGTNHWGRGLGVNATGVGEPNSIIMQATANALADMNAQPATPSNITVDGTAAPQVTGRTPAPGATGVQTTSSVTATFAQSPDPATVTAASFTLSGPAGTVPATVTYDAGTRTATLTPTAQLDGLTAYTATLTTAIKGWNGVPLASNVAWSYTTASGSPPTVTSRTPAAGATNVAYNAKPTATFDRALDPATVTNASFTLTPAGGTAVQATATYDGPSRTATLTPTALLVGSTTYTARLTTAVKATDGAALAADVSWTFTTKASPGPFTVTSRVPAPLSNGISPATNVRAVFSRSVDPATLTATTFKLVPDGGSAVPATISYDDTTRTATLTPTSALAPMQTYTATLTTGVKGIEDNTPLSADSTWTFTTAFSAPPAPALTATSPLAGVTGAPLDSVVQATFDRVMDPATLTNQTFTITAAGAPPTVAAVSYDTNTNTATLTPAAPLAVATEYTARVTTGARSSVGAPLSADVTWKFTTLDCPCQLFSNSLAPASTNLSTQDGRAGTGPFTYELGVKFTVDAPADVTSLRFYKDANETGTHVGRIWGPTGSQLAQVTYAGETASGWQKQKLNSPVTLQPGNVYTASVGVNARWVSTLFALGSPVVSGPLRTVADGANGVYGNSAGTFPTSSYGNSNYFVDVVVKGPGQATAVPHVVGQQPSSGASGVDQTASVKATFDIDIDPATVTGSTFTLSGPGGSSIPASVSYNASSRTATLTPSEPLTQLTTYTARVTTGVKSEYSVPMSALVAWNFTTAPNPPPGVQSTSPGAAATGVSGLDSVRATFNQAMDAATITSSTFTLKAAGGTTIPASVTYSDVTRTATLTPAVPLTSTTDYVAIVTTDAANTDGVRLSSPYSWSFTTSSCPCRLFDDSVTPQLTQLATQDGRSGTGPWSYELGVKIKVTSAAKLSSIRFYKSANETGTHVGRLWNATGTLLASTTFSGESASGWQSGSFATPVDLSPGQTYVVSVGFNAFFSVTFGALANEIVSGPLRSVADGNNGVYGGAAGTFPTASYNNSSYLVDPVVG